MSRTTSPVAANGNNDSSDSVFISTTKPSGGAGSGAEVAYRGGRGAEEEPQRMGAGHDEFVWTKKKKVIGGAIAATFLCLAIIVPLAIVLGRSNANNDPATATTTTTTPLPESAAVQGINLPFISNDEPILDDGDGNDLEKQTVAILESLEIKNETDPTTTNKTTKSGPPTTTQIPSAFRPPPVADCSAQLGQGKVFVCTEDGLGVGIHRRCDGVLDCALGSDEDNCTECRTSFACPGRKGEAGLRCLRSHFLCDGVVDCGDGADEGEFCDSHEQCPAGLHQCGRSKLVEEEGNGSRCLNASFLCDGETQCPGGDDEMECGGECAEGSFWCGAGERCLRDFSRCDGVWDCPDGEDELGCDCERCLAPDVALCPGDSAQCISRDQICDSVENCEGGEDEIGCPGSCTPDARKATLRCSDGRDYPLRYACSGLVSVCEAECKACDPETSFACPNHKLGPHCLQRSLLCDGIAQCEGGEDEAEGLCNCVGDDIFRCPPMLRSRQGGNDNHNNHNNHTKCLPSSYRCDGYADCPGGEDEEDCADGCSNAVPGLASFQCEHSHRCLPSISRCDGIPDCDDLSDEKDCDCTECKSQLYPTFLCEGGLCLKASYVCDVGAPFHCPGFPKLPPHCQANFDPLQPL